MTRTRMVDQGVRHAWSRRSSFAAILLLAFVAPSSAQPGVGVGRARYAAELHKINAPLLALYDAFYLFTNNERSVAWVTEQTQFAERSSATELRRLSGMVPPSAVQRQHRRIIAALARLQRDLQRPIALATKGRAAVLGWWLQTYTSLPEIKTLSTLHDSLSRLGYWG